MEDKKKTNIIPKEKQACSVYVEPLIKNIYTAKALQSSNQPDTLTWDSVGDQVTYNADGSITMQEWKRQCIFLCSSSEFGDKAGYFLTDYDGYYDLPSYGNKLFKAVMCKLVYDLALPPYTSAAIGVQVYLTFSKLTDNSKSSTWVAGITMEWDHCKTIGENNHEHDKWSGVPSSAVYFSTEYNMPYVDAHCLNVFDSKQTAENTSDKTQHHLLSPIYLMSMLERPQSYNTFLGVGDMRPNEDRIIVTPQFTSLISYNNNEVQKYTYSDRRTKGILLKKPERTGYIMKGWLDGDSGWLYPAGGYYAEKRGINLTEQWVEDVVPYTVAHYHADGKGNYSYSSETFYYMAGGLVCPQPDQNAAYKTPEPITACVAGDGSTVIAYYYEIAKYPVQYSANGGEFKDGTDYVESSLSYGEKIPENNLLAYRQGYTFEKWEPQLPQKMPCNAVTTRIVWAANNYTVKYDKNDANATGEMEPQGFVYDQPQQLCKNEYKCKHTVSFAVGERRGDNAYFQPQTAECHFMGWAETAAGEKAYDDGATVCNLTSERDGEKTLYAVWKSVGILLPQLQIYHDGFYFDAWYLDENFNEKAGEPGSMYIPTKSETLYGKVVCTGVKNTRWVQGEEPVDERTIAAEWDEMKEATAYRVGLESAQEGEDKKNYPFLEEDFMGDDIKLTEDGMAEVKGCRLDLTKALKRFTAGGSFKFSVAPVIPNFPQENIRRTVSPAITTLARPNDEDLKWDGIKAVWKKIEGAEYYLIWMIDEQGEDITEQGIEYSSYGLLTGGAGDKAIQVEAGVGPEESAEIGNVADDNGCIVKFELLAYSDTCYTPPYVMPESDYRR